MAKYHIGYTQGVFDMLHTGHVNLINNAKRHCDILIVGVNSDALVMQYKHKKTVIPEDARRYIVANLKAVDECVIVDTLDKETAWQMFHFDAIFIGDDWKGNARWLQTEQDLMVHHVPVVYLPHTDGISSTILKPHAGESVRE